jgi:hypothetical protein
LLPSLVPVGVSATLAALLLLCLQLPSFAGATLGLSAPQLYERGIDSLLSVGVSRNDLNADVQRFCR